MDEDGPRAKSQGRRRSPPGRAGESLAGIPTLYHVCCFMDCIVHFGQVDGRRSLCYAVQHPMFVTAMRAIMT